MVFSSDYEYYLSIECVSVSMRGVWVLRKQETTFRKDMDNLWHSTVEERDEDSTQSIRQR